MLALGVMLALGASLPPQQPEPLARPGELISPNRRTSYFIFIMDDWIGYSASHPWIDASHPWIGYRETSCEDNFFNFLEIRNWFHSPSDYVGIIKKEGHEVPELDQKFYWHEGRNTGRVLDIGKGVRGRGQPQYAGHQIFRVRLANLYYQYLPLVYVVPHGSKLHQVIKDLDYFYKKRDSSGKAAKPWIEISLRDNKDERPGMRFSIVSLDSIESPTFDEIEQLSLKLRKELSEKDLGPMASIIVPGGIK